MSAQLENRTKVFALDVVCFCADLPHAPEIGHIAGSSNGVRPPLQRTTGPPAAENRKPIFIAKLGTVEEEADESEPLSVWSHFRNLRRRSGGLRLGRNKSSSACD